MGMDGGFLRDLWRRVRAARPAPSSGRALRPLDGGAWVAVASDVPQALGEMFVDVLRQQGIPARLTSLGVGSGALGGVPLSAQVLVPAERAAEARELLRADGDDAGGDHPRADGPGAPGIARKDDGRP
jgi:hypothetical protein